MSSTAKALEFLSYFSTARPEIGLSQLGRLAGKGKATTYRYMQALEKAGLIEQNSTTRHYRLGPALMQLAHIREATVPRKSTAIETLKRLANVTGETSHVTILSNKTLYSLCECESPHHAIRAVIDLNTFPLHATASGLCALAFGPKELMSIALENLQAFTKSTATQSTELEALVHGARQIGFGQAKKSFEDEIEGVAAPIFDQSGQFAGAVAVACVASRFDENAEIKIKSELIKASQEITRNWGGVVPAYIEDAWLKATLVDNEQHPTH